MKKLFCRAKSICHNKVFKKSGVYCGRSDSRCDFQNKLRTPPIVYDGRLPKREDYKVKHFYKRK